MKKTNITVDGVEYEIDVKQAIKQGILKQQHGPKPGSKFQDVCTRREYVLSGFNVNDVGVSCLINVYTGNVFRDPIVVGNLGKITWDEWQRIGGNDEDIVRIDSFTPEELIHSHLKNKKGKSI